MRLDLPDRLADKPFEVTIIVCNGNSSQYFVNFDIPFAKTEVQTFGKLGNATVRIIDTKKCREVLTRICSREKEEVCFGIKELPEALYKQEKRLERDTS